MSITKTMALIGLGALIASCTSTKQTSSFSPEGKWDITSVNNNEVATGMAYIHFTEDGKISGNSGCNRMMGSYTLDKQNKSLLFSQISSTRMMCRDMQTEQAILNALEKTKTYQTDGDNNLTLNDNEGNRLMTITRHIPTLDGTWNIIDVRGKAVHLADGSLPYLDLDLQLKRANGLIGDNRFNADLKTDGNSLEFLQGAATMMMGPNQEIEDLIKSALNEVKQYQIREDGTLILQDAQGTTLLKLQQQD